MGPVDHGFVQSIYFEGPEGLNLEIACGSAIDERAWIDPEVTGLCGISDEELERMMRPDGFTRPAEAVAQPTEPHPENVRAARDPERFARVAALPDDFVWENLSETTPPVVVDNVSP